MIVGDFSLVGEHGIGRFAAEVFKRCGIEAISVDCSTSSPFYSFFLAKAFSKSKALVLFSPSYMPPLWSTKKFVFTVHDLNHIDRPENSSFLKRIFYALVIRRGCHAASAILTVSEFSRQRIISWSGVNPAKVINVGNGVDVSFRPDGPRYEPGFQYFFCVSNRRLHKNEPRLLEAFANANLAPSIRLVLTGEADSLLTALIERLGIGDRVVFAGKILETELPGYYRGAQALLFPSLYEGFGLPVLEAMACGTPVLTSNVTSLPEIAGEAALFVDPESVAEISFGISTLCNDLELRDVLVARGLRQARLFSWESVADRVNGIISPIASPHDLKGRSL